MILRHIRYLAAVAEHQNFTRAAEALHVSQPTLSQQIKQLENSLHVQLLDRSGRTVRLTDAGETFLRYTRRALRDLDAGTRAIHDVQDLSRGSLRLAMTPTFTAYLIGPLVERFGTRYPGITLSLQEMTQDRIEVALAEDTLDLGIAFAEVRSSEIEAQALFVETLGLVVGNNHPHAGQQAPMTLRELEQEQLVLLRSDFATRGHIDGYFRNHGVAPRIAIEVDSVSAIMEIVRRGQLATMLPEAIAREQHGLNPVAVLPAIPHRTAALLRRKGAYMSATSRAFTELISTWS
ncbi:transcriptional regulator CynR [Cryobacterium sp. TMS1-13-1]|uniref:transcriptional regulator CynR n=1 Tax=Cryobacterium sp. TMS1-13-1 TaxID=1259220 RepID=UPI00106D912E|nr:transcriptional regulator CynR [Cryobacterium sp. TMS1-13-1]TFD21347.1 transcriptional regulator CynR [Cryobacterium sp. TMS1-13-1]